MKEILLMNLEGPMMSFGGVAFDSHPDTLPFPGKSMMAGLIGNALGYERREGNRLNSLQAGMRTAIGIIRKGHQIVDFQTVDLQRPHMQGQMWTGKARLFERNGSADALTRQIRHLPYFADARLVYAVEFSEAAGTTATIALQALREPARPLFIGRKSNIPSAPIGHDIIRSASPIEAVLSMNESFAEVWSDTKPSSTSEFVELYETKDFNRNSHSGVTRYWRIA